MSSFIDRYNAISKELGYEYPKKGTKEYEHIMRVLNNRYPKKEPTESQKKWQQSCEALGYRFVRKGTKEYDAVKKYFSKI